MNANATLMSLKGVEYRAPDGKPVLGGVDLDIESGEVIWISGPSGGGKSTLLRLLNRLISPTKGLITFQGRDLDQWPPAQLRRQVVLMPQLPVMTGPSLRESLMAPFALKSAQDGPVPGEAALKLVLAGLDLSGLGLDRPVEGLSVGQLQRVALSRALLMNPKMLLLDEPVASLDPDSQALVEARAVAAAADGKAVVLVSHQAPKNCPYRALVLFGGRLQPAS